MALNKLICGSIRVTEREDELAARVAALEDAVKARDDFLAIAAHELRNPMYALSLHLQLAVNKATKLGDRDLIQALEGANISLRRYVGRATTLLDVSRINAGNRQLHIDDLDLAAIVRQVADSHVAEAAYTGAVLQLDLPDSLPGRWDGLAVEQVIDNLLSNAIKFGAGKPVEVTLAGDGAYALLTVRDHGPGIAHDDLERIFGQFEQAVSGTMRSGFGIGLWLVRSLLEAHGGSIKVESDLGAGATFLVRLPVDATSFGPQSP